MTEIVSFVYNKPTPTEGALGDKLLPDREILFNLLQERGLQPMVSTHREEAFAEEGYIQASVPMCDGSLIMPGSIERLEIDSVGALVNRAGRSLQRTDLPPTINEKATRLLGHDKDRTHSEILEPLGLGAPTLFAKNELELEAFLEGSGEHDFVVKPARNSNFGKGVMMLSADEVRCWFKDNPSIYGTQLVQPRFDFDGPFPPAVKPYDSKTSELFGERNMKGARKELRMYGFFANGSMDMFPVARTLDPHDEWFFLDPQSVPQQVYEQTHAVIRRVAQVSVAKALYGCVDFGYGRSATTDRSFHIIEANLRSPYLLGTERHPQIAIHLREMFAAMLARTVVRD